MTRHYRAGRSYLLVAVTTLLMLAIPACGPALPTLIPTLVVPTAADTLSATIPPTLTAEDTLTPSITPSITPTFTETSTFTVTPTFTITPTFSRTPTITRTPSITPTPLPPVAAVIVEKASCNYGPGGAYQPISVWNETSWMWVIGRIQDGSWLFIRELYIKTPNPCWIKTSLVRFNDGGDVNSHNIPVLDPDNILPYPRNLYPPPTGVEARRFGDKVVIDWNAVWMTEDDYRGYLIEAWVCQGGQLVFKPFNYLTSVKQNSGTLYYQYIDETGCSEPSHARIYTSEKHGYTWYVNIPWPPNYGYTATPTRTATP